jgi:hypothetical protein
VRRLAVLSRRSLQEAEFKNVYGFRSIKYSDLKEMNTDIK